MFKLAHISDPHLSAVPKLGFTDLASKRLFGLYNWRRNRVHAYAPAILDALVADMKAAQPDHSAITGDLVNLGLGAEIIAAGQWLQSVAPPDEATLIPGNHDAYMPQSIAGYLKEWSDYMTGDGASPDTVAFPFVRRRGPLALVGVSTAVATPPLMATGEIGEGQAAALAKILVGLAGEKRFRIVLIHHSPVKGATSWYRRLTDAGRVRRVLAEAGAELVLHGHNHHTHVDRLPGRDGPVPVVGVAAASMLPSRGKPGGSYCLYEIGTETTTFSCKMTERGVRNPGGPVETLSEVTLA